MKKNIRLLWLVAWLSATAILQHTIYGQTTASAPAQNQQSGWSTLISAQDLHDKLKNPDLLVIDVRSPAEYAAGHITGAINLPGVDWRTPAATPGQVGQKIFRKADGTIDAERYEKLLSAAGVKPEHDVVIYGNYAGKADGSLPAALLLKLGHDKVAFLDGVGIDEWRTAGYPTSTEPTQLAASDYHARPDDDRLWSYEDVIENLNNPEVVIVDSRTPAEYEGKDLRGNKRGGHIPGAKLFNAEDFLDQTTHKTIALEAARKRLEAEIPKDKTVVIYCQSGTRCSHKELILKDLGYKNVVLYDSSWQEWGNRLDTPIEESTKPEKPVDEN